MSTLKTMSGTIRQRANKGVMDAELECTLQTHFSSMSVLLILG